MERKIKQKGGMAGTFKIWVVAVVFMMTFFHLYVIRSYPGDVIVSDKILLGIVLILVGYLWIQELRDRQVAGVAAYPMPDCGLHSIRWCSPAVRYGVVVAYEHQRMEKRVRVTGVSLPHC